MPEQITGGVDAKRKLRVCIKSFVERWKTIGMTLIKQMMDYFCID